MKKKFALITGIILGLFSMSSIASATTTGMYPQGNGNHVNVYLNDQLLSLDVPAKVINNRTMVPLRGLFESMGAQVQWVQATRSIVITKDSTTIEMALNSTSVKVNGQATTLDVPPSVVNDRTLVPVHFISTALGASVGWDSGTDSVFVTLRPLPSTKLLVDYLQGIQPYGEASDQASNTASGLFTDYMNKKISYSDFKAQYDAQMKIMQDSINSMKNVTVADDSFVQAAAEKYIGAAEEKYEFDTMRENAIYSDHVDSVAMKNAYNQFLIVHRDITALNTEFAN